MTASVGNVALKGHEGGVNSRLKTRVLARYPDEMAAIAALSGAIRADAPHGSPVKRSAALPGLRGLVFKSHGSVDAGLEQAWNRAHGCGPQPVGLRPCAVAHAAPLLTAAGAQTAS